MLGAHAVDKDSQSRPVLLPEEAVWRDKLEGEHGQREASRKQDCGTMKVHMALFPDSEEVGHGPSLACHILDWDKTAEGKETVPKLRRAWPCFDASLPGGFEAAQADFDCSSCSYIDPKLLADKAGPNPPRLV